MSFEGLLPQPPYPWLGTVWQVFVTRVGQARLPHALLIVGQSGLGCVDLAKAMAQYLLCMAPTPAGSCGKCRACQLLRADTHPDLLWIRPEEGAQGIKVAQIRDMTEFTSKTAQQGGRKLIILSPADAMNTNAANALLKSLEEPSGDCVFLLVTEQPAFLLATIRSRCSRIPVSPPEASEALRWLERNRVADAETLLSAAGGRPLRVMEWLANDFWEQRRQLEQELRQLLAGGSFLDSAKTLLGFGPLWVIEQLQTWLAEAVRTLHRDGQNPDGDELVQQLARAGTRRLMPFYDALLKKKALLLSTANPNPQMMLDEIMMEMQDLYRKKD
jgi:DNA polymerase-3 subunit delta'